MSQSAEAIRREWMELYGLDEYEIDQHCAESPPVDAEAERIELDAVKRIQGIR